MSFAVAVAVLAVLAEAGGSPFRGRDIDGKWRAPRETQAVARIPGELAYMAQIDLQQTPVFDTAPATTAPATLFGRHFWERDKPDNTCAYISGKSSDSLYCSATADCVADAKLSVMGCCAGSNQCSMYTKCLPRASSTDFTTDNGLTLFCNDASYPECVTHKYVGSVYKGYTLLGCGKSKSKDEVYYQPTTETTTTTTSTTSQTLVVIATKTTKNKSTTTTKTGYKSSGKGISKNKIGPVVGGVVGGIAAIAGILGLAWLFRQFKRNKRNKAAASVHSFGGPGESGSVPDAPLVAHKSSYSGLPGGDVAGDSSTGAAAYHQYGQSSKPDGTGLYDPYDHDAPQQQPYDARRDSMHTVSTMSRPQSMVADKPPPYGGASDAKDFAAQRTGSAQSAVAAYKSFDKETK